jgi:hypothetical protein
MNPFDRKDGLRDLKSEMPTRAQIEAARSKEVADHNQKMMAFDAFLKLVDPATDSVPEHIMALFSSASEVASKPQDTVLRPLNNSEIAIHLIFKRFPSGEFTSASIRDQLVEEGFSLSQNRDVAMNGISAALGELVARNLIVRTYQGRGRDPHRYRLAPTLNVEAS